MDAHGGHSAGRVLDPRGPPHARPVNVDERRGHIGLDVKDRSQRARREPPLELLVGGKEPSVVGGGGDHPGAARRLDPLLGGALCEAEGLIDQNVLLGLRRGDHLGPMLGVGRGDHHRVEPGIRQRRVEIVRHRKPVLGGEFGRIRRRAGNAHGEPDEVALPLHRFDHPLTPQAKTHNCRVDHRILVPF